MIQREQLFMEQVRPLIDSDSEDEQESAKREEAKDDESDDDEYDEYFRTGKVMQNTLQAKREAQAAAAAKIMEEVKKGVK